MNNKVKDELTALRLKWAENERLREIADEPMKERLAVAVAFTGHICPIPETDKRRLREVWLCGCTQVWELVIYDNRRKWRMIEKKSAVRNATHRPEQGF